jgi:excisionase family DNA binding protein
MTKLLTVPEVAERLSLSRPRVRTLIDRGDLKGVVIPGGPGMRRMRRVDPKDLNRFVLGNRVAPPKGNT